MRRKWENSLELRRVRCAWNVSVLCSTMMAFGPSAVLAEEPAPEENPTMDEAEAAEAGASENAAAHKSIEEAQRAIDEAQKQLDEAKRQMKIRIGEVPVQAPSKMPGGVGLVASEGRAKKLQVSLNEDGSLYFRFAAWLQIWTRAMQLNPGTTVLDNPETPELEGDQPAWYADVGIRRARFLAFGQIFPRVFLLMHFGINNQTFRNARKPQLFFHDAWAEFEAVKEHLSIGGGILYWNGISRMTSASTITFMSLDAPIVNWPTIEETDQFARQLGLYAKGKAGLFDYRVAAVRPFTTSVGAPTTVGNYNDAANTWGYSGYFQLQFWDIESNVLPYTVGTYIGLKRVLNLGAGFHAQPKAIAFLNPVGDVEQRTLWIASGDFFADVPIKRENGGAITAYGVYYYMDFGPNNLRSIGIMNPGDPGSGTSLAGPGNAYPMIGTGHTGYAQIGWLVPGTAGKYIKFQPYFLTQTSKFDALEDVMFQFGIGANMFIHDHNAKVTLEYRNRPIFDNTGNAESRAGSSFVLQMHLFI